MKHRLCHTLAANCPLFSLTFPCPRYGLVGRNGTGKTTLLRHLNQKAIKGIPENCQILHVEQEVGIVLPSIDCRSTLALVPTGSRPPLVNMLHLPQVAGDDTTALDAVLQCDTERLILLDEEARLMEQLSVAQHGEEGQAVGQQQQQQQQGAAPPAANGSDPATSSDGLAATQRLAAIAKRLHEIGASSWVVALLPSQSWLGGHSAGVLPGRHPPTATVAMPCNCLPGWFSCSPNLNSITCRRLWCTGTGGCHPGWPLVHARHAGEFGCSHT